MAFLDEWKDKVNTTNGEDGDDIQADDVNLLASGIREALNKEVEIPKNISQLKNDAGYITNADIPKKLSEFENDKGYITESAIPEKISGFENDAGYITKTELAYDTIIHSQEEWDAMVAAENWNGARNILLRSNIFIQEGSGDIEIPAGVKTINLNAYMFVIYTGVNVIADGTDTKFTNGRVDLNGGAFEYIDEFYNCNLFFSSNGCIKRCRRIFGCIYSGDGVLFDCDTVVLDRPKNEVTIEIINCLNVIYQKTNLSEFYNDAGYVTQNVLDSAIGDINSILDELHIYAQDIVDGGASE